MKITNITTTELHCNQISSHPNSSTSIRSARENQYKKLFVHIATDEGMEGLGIGESAPGVRYLIETNLKNLLMDQDPFNIEKLHSDMFSYTDGLGYHAVASRAISAIDIGLWDLKAKTLGLPLYKLLGPLATSIPIHGSGGSVHLSEKTLLEEITGYVKQGIQNVKMEVGKNLGKSEREDIERVDSVRKAVGDDIALYVTAKHTYYPKQAIYMSKQFEEHQVGWLENPLISDNVQDLKELRLSTDIPIASGSEKYTAQGFKDLISQRGIDIVQSNVERIGGVTALMRVAYFTQMFNLPIVLCSAQLINVHVACAIPNLKSIEYTDYHLNADRIWYTDFPEPNDGVWSPYLDKPGIGLELNPYSVERWAV